MSRYSNWYQTNILKAVQQYPNFDLETNEGVTWNLAIEKALKDMKALPEGDKRLEFFDMVYFKKTHRVYGAAYKLGVGERKAQQWSQSFFKAIAKYKGFT